MTKPLSELTILITRPKHQSLPLKQMIEKEGGHCIVRPMLDILPPKDITVFEALPKHIKKADKIIFVTANAVTSLFEPINIIPKNKVLYAMGPSTLSVLKKYVVNNIVIPDPPYNTESFLALNAFKNIANENILILSGEGGRGFLAKSLQERNAIVTKADIYRRQCPDIDLTQELPSWEKNVGLIISTSVESLGNLVKLVGKPHHAWLINKPLLVLSERIAKAAKDMGFQNTIITAQNASDKGIFQSILSWYAQQSNPSALE